MNQDLGDKIVVYDKSIILEQADGLSFDLDEEITLMNWGNTFTVSKLILALHLAGDFKKTKKKITWLATVLENMISVNLVSFDHLIIKNKLEKDDRLEHFLTEQTEFRTRAFADCNVSSMSIGSISPFERKGYYKFDGATAHDSSMVFFEIPSGRS